MVTLYLKWHSPLQRTPSATVSFTTDCFLKFASPTNSTAVWHTSSIMCCASHKLMVLSKRTISPHTHTERRHTHRGEARACFDRGRKAPAYPSALSGRGAAVFHLPCDHGRVHAGTGDRPQGCGQNVRSTERKCWGERDGLLCTTHTGDVSLRL